VPADDIIETFAREYPGFVSAESAPATQFRKEAGASTAEEQCS
jgi:hypothetical protein